MACADRSLVRYRDGLQHAGAGNYSQWLEARAARLKQEGKEQSALQRAMDAELDFVRSQAKGQQKKGKARMRRYDELVDQARGPLSGVRYQGQ